MGVESACAWSCRFWYVFLLGDGFLRSKRSKREVNLDYIKIKIYTENGGPTMIPYSNQIQEGEGKGLTFFDLEQCRGLGDIEECHPSFQAQDGQEGPLFFKSQPQTESFHFSLVWEAPGLSADHLVHLGSCCSHIKMGVGVSRFSKLL